MSDRLRHTTSSPASRERYGTWDLSSDRPPVETPLEAPLVEHDMWLDAENEAQIERLMRRQLRLSLAAALVLLVPVFAFVVAVHAFRDSLGTPVWHGFSIAFLVAAVLIYPTTWLVALIYTLVANRMDGLS